MRYIIFLILLSSCSKQWLDEKPDKTQVVPSSIEELQALMDDETFLNLSTDFNLQQLAETGCDNYFLELSAWQTLSGNSLPYQKTYIFSEQIFAPQAQVGQWNTAYQRILYTNIVLEGLDKYDPAMQGYAEARGNALFVRAHSHFWLMQNFAPAYDAVSAANDLGIPLRLSSDMSEVSVRASVKACYDQIVEDLKIAAPLVPVSAEAPNRVIRPAVNGLLARTYLAMQQYDQALIYADACLADRSALIDYNTLDTLKTYPVPAFNIEVLYVNPNNTSVFAPNRCRVDTVLYSSYHVNDLRRPVFFKKVANSSYYSFNGSYEGRSAVSGGINLDEIFFIKAECEARKGSVEEAMRTLNRILVRRWRSGEFTDLIAADADEALEIILAERRKELCFRGLRWIDLRRLNKEERFQTTVRRRLDGQEYTLLPNSINYVYPIPPNVIRLTGMPQNPRL